MKTLGKYLDDKEIQKVPLYLSQKWIFRNDNERSKSQEFKIDNDLIEIYKCRRPLIEGSYKIL